MAIHFNVSDKISHPHVFINVIIFLQVVQAGNLRIISDKSFFPLISLFLYLSIYRTFLIHLFFVISQCSFYLSLLQFSPQSCPTLCDPMDCSTPGFPVLHQPQSSLKLMSIESVMPSNRLILCHPLLLLPSVFPSIRGFSNESVLHIRWPKYWSFSFSISPSNQYLGLISFRIDLVGSPCSPRDSQESSPIPQFKSINSLVLSFLYISTLTSIRDYWKNHSFN